LQQRTKNTSIVIRFTLNWLKNSDSLKNQTKIFNADETGFPLNNTLRKIISEEGKRDVIKLTSVKDGQNVSVAACFGASGVYIPPFEIFKGVRFRETYRADVAAGSVAQKPYSGYINDNLFLKWLDNFD